MASARLPSSKYNIYRTNKRVTVNWNHVEYIDQFETEGADGELRIAGTEIHFVSGRSVKVEDVFAYVQRDMLFGKS